MTHASRLAIASAFLLLAQPALAQPTPATSADPAAIRGREDASLVGALTEFAYERGALYAVEASPQRITDIALEPGETLLSVSAGDTTRWIVGDARSGAGATGQAHVLVKPNAPRLSTNMIIMTDRRVYHVELSSTAGPAMSAISWRYPVEMTLQGQPAPPAPMPTAALQPEPVFSPQSLNLRYRIEGDKPDWRPLSAFDDGQRVFIEMPARIGVMEAPPLFVIGDDGPELVNYRLQANFYVVDRLFAQAELRLGSGWGQKTVRIVRQTPIASLPQAGDDHG
ncbi:MAG: P-type conjugative transfer protein TrbG [Hyphomonadaceae bacterium]